jgi:DNA invertase Pin-like site-specific DNA recombinase
MDYGYIRVSTDDQSLGIEAQQNAIRNAANAEIHCHIDQLSGTTAINKRPGLLNLLGKLVKGDRVFVLRRDRIARDVVIAGMIVRLIEKRGAELVSVDGIGNGDGPEAMLIATVVDAVAQYERAMISLRTAAALKVKRDRGEKTGGTVPFGFDVVTKHGKQKLVVNKAQHDVIGDMAEMRDSGLSFAAIAKALNHDSVGGPTGGKWYGNTVRRVLARAYGDDEV